MNLTKEKNISIFGFLITAFTTFFTIFIFSISVAIFYQIKHQNNILFKYQMQITAKALESIFDIYPINDGQKQTHIIFDQVPKSFLNIENYNENIGVRVYDPKTNTLLLKTSNLKSLPDIYETSNIGFNKISGVDSDGNPIDWYTYTLKTSSNQLVTVFVNSSVKDKISNSVIKKAIILLILTYIFLITFTFYILKLALKPIKVINDKVSNINPRANNRLKTNEAPYEIRPLINQINSLIDKFQNILDREKRFSGDAAHELKTPIAGIKTQVQIALSYDNIDEIKEKLKKIMGSADRYSHIIDQLLVLSRIQPNESINLATELPINKTLETVIADNAIQAIEKNIAIEFNHSDKEIFCHSNDYLMSILMKNIISNAIKYTKPDGSIEISTQKLNDKAIIKVKDTGIGVPKENLERIFDRFYRETGTKQEGSGLGLAIVAEIIRLHKGYIVAENNSNSVGITITIELPIVA